MGNSAFTQAIVRGLPGGFVATMIMDVLCAGLFGCAGMPLDLTYSFIGDVAGIFFLKIGIDLPGSRLLGAVVHFSIGVAGGGLLGLAVSRIKILRAGALRRRLLLIVLCTAFASQPIVVTAPLLADMTLSGIFQWYALSTVMHSIYACVLGLVFSYKQKEIASAIYPV